MNSRGPRHTEAVTPLEVAPDGKPMVQPLTREAWRAWLQENHRTHPGLWLANYKKATGKPRLEYEETVEEALCFGWIDSRANSLDAERSLLWVCPSKATSAWSGINKERVARLVAKGLMEPAGLAVVEEAKASGRWSALDEVELLIVPTDLSEAFDRHPASRANWDQFPPSARRAILDWISQAKRAETRLKRIEETATLADRNERANQWEKRPGS